VSFFPFDVSIIPASLSLKDALSSPVLGQHVGRCRSEGEL